MQQLALEVEQCYDLARALGFAVTTTPLDPGKLTYCYADRVSQFLFNHEGDVFKCTVGKFTPQERLGVLNDRGAITWEGSAYDDWMAIPAIDDKCRQCSFLPMCMGGCRKTRMFTGKSGPDCTLPFAALESRVQQRYSREVRTAPDQPIPVALTTSPGGRR
jgi:radical SAM protein with 4Fe4S-binding SPASM domain